MAKAPVQPPAAPAAIVEAPPPRPAVEPPQSFLSPRNVPLWASLVLAAIVAFGIWAKQQGGG
jgi:hypothetical protein